MVYFYWNMSEWCLYLCVNDIVQLVGFIHEHNNPKWTTSKLQMLNKQRRLTNAKQTLLKTIAAVWFNRICRANGLRYVGTHWSVHPLEKLTVVQEDETFFIVYATQWVITMLATLDPILSQTNPVHVLTHLFFNQS